MSNSRSPAILFFLAALAAPFTPKTAVLTNPHGPLIAFGMNLFDIPALEANLHGHHMFTGVVGLTLAVEVGRASPILVRANHTGMRIGPRFALRGRGLKDYYTSAFAVAGVSSISSGDGWLARWGVAGGGAEIGRTWVWGRFVFELGAGLYATTNLGYASKSEVLSGGRPGSILPIKPLFNGSIGYAF